MMIFFIETANSSNFELTYNASGENPTISVKGIFTYHEKIDPITDKNTSYVEYSDPFQSKATSALPFAKSPNWGMLISCYSDQPKMSFTLDCGNPVQMNSTGIRTSSSEVGSFGLRG